MRRTRALDHIAAITGQKPEESLDQAEARQRAARLEVAAALNQTGPTQERFGDAYNRRRDSEKRGERTRSTAERASAGASGIPRSGRKFLVAPREEK